MYHRAHCNITVILLSFIIEPIVILRLNIIVIFSCWRRMVVMYVIDAPIGIYNLSLEFTISPSRNLVAHYSVDLVERCRQNGLNEKTLGEIPHKK